MACLYKIHVLSNNFYDSEVQAQFSWVCCSMSPTAELKRSARLYSHLEVLGKHLLLCSFRLLEAFISLWCMTEVFIFLLAASQGPVSQHLVLAPGVLAMWPSHRSSSNMAVFFFKVTRGSSHFQSLPTGKAF